MSTIINAGRIAPLPKGLYDASTQYVKLDIVTFSNESYICKQACKGIAPTNGDYWQLLAGAAGGGKSIVSITLTSSVGLVDTYTIKYTDASTSTFTVTNGKDGEDGTNGRGIISITKTASHGLIDTYTITYSDRTNSTYQVTNGANGAAGRGISSITKTGTSGLVDTYTITYTDGTTSTYQVTNGEDGEDAEEDLMVAATKISVSNDYYNLSYTWYELKTRVNNGHDKIYVQLTLDNGTTLKMPFDAIDTDGFLHFSADVQEAGDSKVIHYDLLYGDDGFAILTATPLQDKLVSGTNIKTINNQSLLGSGNINIQGGGDMSNYYTKSETNGLLNAKQDTLTFDAVPTEDSSNPVTSGGLHTKFLYIEADLADKQDALVSGTNIKTVNGGSLLGSGDIDADDVIMGKIDGTSFYRVTGYSGLNATPTFSDTAEVGNENKIYVDILSNRAYRWTKSIVSLGESKYKLLSEELSIVTDNELNSLLPSSTKKAVSAKVLRDNFYTKSEVNNAIVDSNPVIEDTRSSEVAAITGVAPFDTLVDGQKIVVKLKYKTSANATLTLTGLTNALPIYARCNNNNNSAITPIYFNAFVANSYMELIYDATNSRWICTNYDRVMAYEVLTQSRIDSSSTAQCVITGKLLRDNFYLKTEIDATIGAKADKVQEVEVSGATPTTNLLPNAFYQFTGAVTSLTLTLGTPIDGITNIYAFSFVAGAANPTISLPSSVTIDGTPSIAQGDYVEFSIQNDIALYKVVSI